MAEMIKKISKKVIYKKIIQKLDAYFDKITAIDDEMRMATINAILKINLPYISFVGFYRVHKNNQGKEELLIGPYQGELIACAEIAYTRGVCGKCALAKKTINVPNVNKFPGYIACDAFTKSEIVVPVMRQGKLIAVLDIDSDDLNSFDKVDEFYLEYIVKKYFN